MTYYIKLYAWSGEQKKYICDCPDCKKHHLLDDVEIIRPFNVEKGEETWRRLSSPSRFDQIRSIVSGMIAKIKMLLFRQYTSAERLLVQ
jgi:hypothetical protein